MSLHEETCKLNSQTTQRAFCLTAKVAQSINRFRSPIASHKTSPWLSHLILSSAELSSRKCVASSSLSDQQRPSDTKHDPRSEACSFIVVRQLQVQQVRYEGGGAGAVGKMPRRADLDRAQLDWIGSDSVSTEGRLLAGCRRRLEDGYCWRQMALASSPIEYSSQWDFHAAAAEKKKKKSGRFAQLRSWPIQINSFHLLFLPKAILFSLRRAFKARRVAGAGAAESCSLT